jgi:transporter family protein
MTEPALVLLSATVALFMVVLLRAGVSPELRAAIRTTVVVLLGWGFAYTYYGLKSGSDLSWSMEGMFLISVLAVLFAWLFYFRAIQVHSVSPAAVTDRVNVGFAVAFAVLFVSNNLSAQSALIGFILVGGAAMLAFGAR